MMVWLGREPRVGSDAFGDLDAGLDVGRLHVDRADPQLLVAEKTFEVVGHIVLDQIRVTLDPARVIGFVAAKIKVTMADLPIVIGTNRIVAWQMCTET